MASGLPQDGIQFIAQDASKFIGALEDVESANDALSNSLVDLTDTIDALGDDMLSYSKAGDAVEKTSGSATKEVKSFAKGFTLLDGVMLKAGEKLLDFAMSIPKLVIDGLKRMATALFDVGKAMATLATEASQLQGIASGFGNFAAQTEMGAEAILASLQAASAGMISTADLMTKFNDAAALVSVQFAERLPEGLEILGKVSAATGKDLNFLLDSFVTGIGRVSPMILDNLKIQVGVAEATAFAAEMFGKEEKALTKVEQQMALTELTLTKLTEKFGDLPDVTQSATANLARIDAQLADIGAQIGSAFLPAWTTLTATVSDAVAAFSEATQKGGVLFPVLANLGAAASILADTFSTAVGRIVDFATMLGFTMTNVAEVTTSSLIQMQGEGGDVLENIGTDFDSIMQDTIFKALDWGINIATNFAQGLIDGAAVAIGVAMDFIAGMLGANLEGQSPPKVAPKLPEWGASAMTEYLKGFMSADFGVLKGIQGPLSKVLEKGAFADVSQAIAAAMAGGGPNEQLFATIAASAGEFGTEIADLARLEFELVDANSALTAAEMAQTQATDGVADAQKRLDEALRGVEETDKDVAAATEEYNRLLRAGADSSALEAQLALINAAERQRDAAIEQNRTAMASLDTAEMVKEARDDEAEAATSAAQAEADAAAERLKNQTDLVNQLITLSEKEKDAAEKKVKGKKGKGGVVTPDVIAKGPLAPAFDFTGGLTKAIDDAKGLMLSKFGTIFDPIKQIIADKFGPGSPIYAKMLEISKQLREIWDTKLVPFWEETLNPAIETAQLAFENMETFWENSAIPELAGEAFGMLLDTVMKLGDRAIPFFADQLLKISEWFLDNSPLIDTFAEAMVEAWGMILDVVVLAWDVMEPILSAIIDTIGLLGTATLQFVTGDWTGAWETAQEILVVWSRAAILTFFSYLTGLNDMMKAEPWAAFMGSWAGAWDNVLLIVTEASGFLLTEITKGVQAITLWVLEQADTFKGWGRDMIRGMAVGIAEKTVDVIESVSEMVRQAIETVKDLFNMGSPSRVMADFGANVVEGFVQGIVGGEQMVANAMGSMLGADGLQPIIQPSFGGAALATQGAQPMMREVSIQIGPNYFQNGNAQQLRQMVRQVMRDELRRR